MLLFSLALILYSLLVSQKFSKPYIHASVIFRNKQIICKRDINRKNPLSSGKLLYCIILHFHKQLILESLIRKRYFLFSFKNNLFQLRVLYLTSFWILGMQPRNVGHGRGQWNHFFRKIYIKMEFSSQGRVMLLSLTTKWCQFWSKKGKNPGRLL